MRIVVVVGVIVVVVNNAFSAKNDLLLNSLSSYYLVDEFCIIVANNISHIGELKNTNGKDLSVCPANIIIISYTVVVFTES